MLPTSYQYEAPEVQIQNTRLRGLTTPDPGNQGMGNGLGLLGPQSLILGRRFLEEGRLRG